MKLLLFDIDGTLLYSNGNGKRALMEATEKVFGKEPDPSISMAGKTDKMIVSELLSQHYSKEEVSKRFPELFPCYIECLKKYYQPERGVGVYSGVVELLRMLQTEKACVTGLLTGNIHEGARVKLGTFDLYNFFQLGAFGDDGFYRNELPDVAVERAKNTTGIDFVAKDIIIIGDTVNDVECGRHLGVRSIAICSNKSTEEQLRASNPDFFFHDFNNQKEMLTAIFS